MKNKSRNTRVSAVEESRFGTYVWETGEGKWIADEEGRFLSVASEKGDAAKIAALKRIAHDHMRQMGVEPSGKAVFLSGHRPIDDEEYEHQKARAAAGLIPDPFDVGAINDDIQAIRRGKL